MAFTKIEKATPGKNKSRPGPVTIYTTKSNRTLILAKDVADKVNIREGDTVDFLEGTGTDHGWFALTRTSGFEGRSIRSVGKNGDVCLTFPKNLSTPLVDSHRPTACTHEVVGTHLKVQIPASMVAVPALAAAE